MHTRKTPALLFALGLLAAAPASAAPYHFSTGDPDGRLAMASGPSGAGQSGIETGDDFILDQPTRLTSAGFTGLLLGGSLSDLGPVGISIYRIFPFDSDTLRTPAVPTRTNSPADVELEQRDTTSGSLSFSTTLLSPVFSASNSVQAGGIHPSPNQTTGGAGAASGAEVAFSASFTTPIELAAGHYFFVPQVDLGAGEFLWLSSARPVAGGTGPFSPDLQTWSRDAALAPDWLRVGTDIIGGNPAPTFNAAFSLNGETIVDGGTIPEPASLALLGLGLAALGIRPGRRPDKSRAPSRAPDRDADLSRARR